MVRVESTFERGSVISELAIVAPILVFLFLAVTEFGRLFRESIGLAQTTYHTVITGGENTRDSALAFMPQTADTLYKAQNRDFARSSLSGGTCGGANFSCTYDQGSGTVNVRVHTLLTPIVKSFNLFGFVNITGPVVVGAQIPPASLNSFKNDKGGEYACDMSLARPIANPAAPCP